MNRGLVALGALAAALGLAAVVRPSVVAGLSLPGVVLTLLGVVALVQGLRVVYGRYSADPPAERDPLPERRHVASVPGREFDASLEEAAAWSRRGGVTDRRQVRERLRTAAVAALTRYEGLSEAEARERLAEGTWTDDPVAAAYFARDGAVSPRLRDRARALVASPYRLRASRAVEQLAAVTGRREGGE